MHDTVAAWDRDRLTQWDKTKWVHNVADEIAAVFGIASASSLYSSAAPLARACAPGRMPRSRRSERRVVRRPVKMMLTRREMFYGVGYRPHTIQRLALGRIPRRSPQSNRA